jgi:hypothetical protein
LTSWTKFPGYNGNFMNLGVPVYAGPLHLQYLDGFIVLLPSHPDMIGSVEVFIALKPETMDVLENN